MWLLTCKLQPGKFWQTVGVVCNLICAHTANFNFNLQSSNSSLIFNLLLLSFSLYYFLLGFKERSHWTKLIGFLPRLMRYCSLTIQCFDLLKFWFVNHYSLALPHYKYNASGVGKQYNSRGAYTVRLHQCTPQVSHTQLTVPTLLRRRCEGGTAHNSNTEVYTSQQELTALNRISAHI